RRGLEGPTRERADERERLEAPIVGDAREGEQRRRRDVLRARGVGVGLKPSLVAEGREVTRGATIGFARRATLSRPRERRGRRRMKRGARRAERDLVLEAPTQGLDEATEVRRDAWAHVRIALRGREREQHERFGLGRGAPVVGRQR